jgi:uncharacterized protein YecE (DUF72 family)
MHPIRLGTCGWSYKEWVGHFYRQGLAAGDFLSWYADRFPVVEVDSTFYRTPSRKMAEGWRDKTPEGFGFSLKVPQVISHEKVLVDCRNELDEFLAAARLLGEKLLCCLLQFGYFNRSKFAGEKAFLERLDPFLAAWPKDVPVAVEVRNKSWIGPRLADCLRGHGAAWALTDQARMPSPLAVVRQLDVVTGPFAYLRLIGDRAEVDLYTKTFNKTVIDRGEQIRSDAETMKVLSDRVPVLAFVNNHFAGFAPETIRQLQEVLAG